MWIILRHITIAFQSSRNGGQDLYIKFRFCAYKELSRPTYPLHSLLVTPLLFFSSRIEGVFYRIRQKLQQYNMEPVTATIKDYVAGAKV